MPETMISIRGAADRLGVHENTIRNWVGKGIIVAYWTPTKRCKLPVAEIERLEREMFAPPVNGASDEVNARATTAHVEKPEFNYPEV